MRKLLCLSVFILVLIEQHYCGVTFRSGGYVRRVLLGGRTIKDGEAAAIWDVNGNHRQVVGPSREWMYRSTIRFLTRHKAEANQYIIVRHRNGCVEHLYGPASIYENPALHDKVSVHDGIQLGSNRECIIVHRDEADAGSGVGGVTNGAENGTSTTRGVARDEVAPIRTIHGPRLFMPAVGERLHQFEWSGVDGTTLTPKQHVFNVLCFDINRTWKPQLHITTRDSIDFTASLVFNYHMTHVHKCRMSKDPIQKMHTALMADAQEFGNTFQSEELRNAQGEVTSRLASLSTFPSLCAAAEAAGFSIDSAQVVGIKYCSELQKQSDHEQQLAAKLRTELAEKTQRRKLHDLELEDRRRRIDQEAELERKQVEVTAKLQEESHSINVAAVKRRLELQRFEADAKHALALEKDGAVLKFLKALKSEGLDSVLGSDGGMATSWPPLAQSATLNDLTAHARRTTTTLNNMKFREHSEYQGVDEVSSIVTSTRLSDDHSARMQQPAARMIGT
eukprot:CAMPEP_0181347912 /NCGR_PEP_ID=MMETSP1101-20121128/34127_1 /TAXON_ID=46948 /ORGANISM="Rhodomonas abbreviata, Strain Caron Lab Isolate" /LENGTH=505 /DNA_ID=CAMNT_0023460149 /DNA_START=134 /DNA_END=1652 /DNA_ORIENTATION=-